MKKMILCMLLVIAIGVFGQGSASAACLTCSDGWESYNVPSDELNGGWKDLWGSTDYVDIEKNSPVHSGQQSAKLVAHGYVGEVHKDLTKSGEFDRSDGILTVWFYDAGGSGSDSKGLICPRGKSSAYINFGIEPTASKTHYVLNATKITSGWEAIAPRSIGWHKVVFDCLTPDLDSDPNTRGTKIYLDGNLVKYANDWYYDSFIEIMLRGYDADANQSWYPVYIDDIDFTDVVPEPATIGLLTFGFGLFVRRN